nr:MAG TPA: hypothetical protein [Siphoviridae sp. ctweK11]DAW32812.1 MAG TPA: hypothetical protein [Caudoviricetes sp.]
MIKITFKIFVCYFYYLYFCSVQTESYNCI